jgi:hypothetical protein
MNERYSGVRPTDLSVAVKTKPGGRMTNGLRRYLDFLWAFFRRQPLGNVLLDDESLAAFETGTLSKANRLSQRVVNQHRVAI